MSISLKELLGSADYNTQTPEIQGNLMTLLEKINKVRDAWNTPMTITSGLRSLDHHIEVYREIAKNKGIPFDESKVPMHSAHLVGAACDVLCTDGKLWQWVHDNITLIEEIGLWMEDDPHTPRVHFQIYPPASGKKIF